MKGVQEEIFGPVVCAVPFSDDDLDRIVKRANDNRLWIGGVGVDAESEYAHKVAAACALEPCG